MKEIIKTIEKYFSIIIGLIILFGLISNKDKLGGIINLIINILTPLISGAFLAYLLNPLLYRIEEKIKIKKYKRGISIAITYTIVLSCIVLLFYSCIPQVVNSIKEILNLAPFWYDNCKNFLEEYELTEFLNYSDSLIETITNYISTILPNVVSGLTNAVRTGFNICIMIIVSFYILIEKDNIKNNLKRFFLAYFKEKKTYKLITIYRDCDYIFKKFFIGKIIDSTIIAIICFFIMTILRLDYAVLMSLLVGITNMIPYIGPWIGGAIGAILLFVVNPSDAFIFVILILILQAFDGYILGPKILGEKVGIRPLWILLSVLIGGSIAGIFGMFMGTPIFAVITYLLNKDIDKKLQEKKEEEEI